VNLKNSEHVYMPGRGLMGNMQDVDLSKVIEKAKVELEHMVDLNPQIMLLMDGSGKVLRVNKALGSFLRLAHLRDAIGRPVWDLLCCEEKIITSLLASAGKMSVTQTEVSIAGGSSILIEISMIKSAGSVHSLIVRDVTGEQERQAYAERQLKRRAAQELVGALLHNLNQPLTVITIRARLIQLAVMQGNMSKEEIGREMEEILTMSDSIAQILSKAEKPRDYVTQQYTAGVQIVDIDKSGDGTGAVSTGIGVLDTLVTILDSLVPDFAMHAHRTSEFARFLAAKMGLPVKDVAVAARAGLLHDIGKIGVPSEILDKIEGLTGEEMREVRLHVEVGGKLLRNFPFLAQEAAAVAAHHERFGGGGYPSGIQGEAIPVLARILAVADTFDVLRYGRPYHKAMKLDEIIAEMISSSGTQFDPAVVEALRANAAEMAGLFSGQAMSGNGGSGNE
jgi:putative nucleotidyltransferase with HDIG domain